MSELEVITYTVTSVKKESFLISEKPPTEVLQGDVHYTINFRLRFVEDIESVIIQAVFKFLHKPENNSLLELSIIYTFKIAEFNKHIGHTPNGLVDVPDNLLLELFSAVTDTSRGYIIAKTEGTFLSNVFLGTVDPKVLLERMKAVAKESHPEI